MTTAPHSTASLRRQLSLWDAASIVVGIIIGSAIYESSPRIAQSVDSSGMLIAVWLIGGAVSFVGALCYAELVTALPREGGDYAFLSEAFGRRVGFVFAWTQFWIVRPGSTGAMAFVFANYFQRLVQWPEAWQPRLWFAVGSLVVMTAINLAGLREGKWTQNVLTSAKVLGLLSIFFAALFAPAPAAAQPVAAEVNYIQALLFVLFAYGGWNDVAFVGGELRDPQRNVWRALFLGVGCVATVYVLANVAFLKALGFEGVRGSQAVASQTMEAVLGDIGGRLVAVLVCISALGAINGMVLTGARVYSAFGQDHRLFAALGKWDERRGTPLRALLAQAAVMIALVVLFGSSRLWGGGDEQGFERLVLFTFPAFWFFVLLAGVALIWLRVKRPDLPRPFRAPLYPLTPLAFCLFSGFLLYSSVAYAIENKSNEAYWSLGILAAGVALAAAFGRKSQGKEEEASRG